MQDGFDDFNLKKTRQIIFKALLGQLFAVSEIILSTFVEHGHRTTEGYCGLTFLLKNIRSPTHDDYMGKCVQMFDIISDHCRSLYLHLSANFLDYFTPFHVRKRCKFHCSLRF